MRDWITFPDGRRGRVAWARDELRAERWQQLLADAHGKTWNRPHCDCIAQGQRLCLSVRETLRNHSSPPVRHYYLARMPFDGPRHAPGCPFHEPDPKRSGRCGYADGVIEERHDGRLRVHLAGSLAQLEQVPRAQAEGSALPDPSAQLQQTEMSLLGLLHLLWEQARLNVLSPDC